MNAKKKRWGEKRSGEDYEKKSRCTADRRKRKKKTRGEGRRLEEERCVSS